MKSRKCSLMNLNKPIEKSRTLGRSLSSMIINREPNEPILEIENFKNQICGLNPYDKEEKIDIFVLIPNGLLLVLTVDKDSTLKQIKGKVFELAAKLPLFGSLHDKSNYLFSCVNYETAIQELLEDDSKLCDVRPFFQTMRLIKKEDDKEEKQLNAQIGILIGKGLHEFDALKSPEVNNYRWLAQEFTQNFEQIRKHCSKAEYVHYNYPVRLERSAQVPIYLKEKLDLVDNKLLIEFRLDTSKIFFTLKVSCYDKIQEVIAKCLKVVNKKLSSDIKNDYVMKVSGREEYLGLLDDYSLIQYTFIRESIANSKIPSFVLKLLNDIKLTNINDLKIDDSKTDKCYRERTMSSFFNQHNKMCTPVCILDLESDIKLKLQIKSAIRINCIDNTMIAIVIGLFQATKLLCPKKCTNAYIVKEGKIQVEELIEFDISVINLPRMCRFSIMLFEIVQQSKNKNSTLTFRATNNNGNSNLVSCVNGACYFNNVNYPLSKRQLTGLPLDGLVASNHSLLVNPLCWVNLTLFDYNGRLRSETITLAMWNYSEFDNSTTQTNNNTITLDDLLFDINSYDDSQFYDLESETLLNPLGTVTWNPNTENSTCLTFQFFSYTNEPNASLFYPTMDRIISYYKLLHDSLTSSKDEDDENDSLERNFFLSLNQSTSQNKLNDENFNVKELEYLVQQMIQTEELEVDQNDSITIQVEDSDCDKIRNCKTKQGYQLLTNRTLFNSTINLSTNTTSSSLTIKGRKASKAYLDQLKEICKKDPLNELNKQDKELIWYLKEFCKRNIPTSLPHLIASVKWNKFKDQVLDLLVLLNDWPLLCAEKGLQLLDFEYSDLFVRRFAVSCIQQFTDEELNLYLFQLVQALKFESYMHNELGEFLLYRALQNPIIGHQLFWLLRSEMNDSSVSIKFGLLLEAYCRGATNHTKVLVKQLDSLNKFREINEFIRQEAFKRKENRDRLKQTMQNILHQSYYRDALQEIINPLNPRQKLNKIKVEKCKFMDSKMKPLWLVFSNEDIGVEDTSIIFKNGDDLRQDMLTIQMLRVFDKLWKDEGLDFRLSFYNVIATTNTKTGLIEVVPNANTIANIQKEKAFTSATSAFQKSSLLLWLKEHNPDEDQLLLAIDEFTKSCAAYCVATFVIGIADRHSDNIMLKSNGQLLHIDFGHILGNFKLKWKIKRERVPFVFTNDFAYVITNGSSKKMENERFEKFLSYCDQAFLVLRRKGTFIMALFDMVRPMMMSTGLELFTAKDLSYLRDTLVLNLTEQEALKHFRNKFDESMKNSWKTSFNWAVHNLAKENS